MRLNREAGSLEFRAVHRLVQNPIFGKQSVSSALNDDKLEQKRTFLRVDRQDSYSEAPIPAIHSQTECKARFEDQRRKLERPDC